MTDANEIARAMVPPRRGQRVLMPLLSLALFLAASSAIYHLLQELNVDRMLAEVRQLSSGPLGLALLLTAASYTVLIGYDWSALRYIGQAVAFRTVAFAAFCGCAIANTVGVNIVSGGSVRYRIYVPAGLGALDVAQVTVFGMVAYGIGNFVLGAAALTLHPDLIGRFLPVPPGLLHGLGVSGLALFMTLAVLFFFRRVPMRIGRWRFRLPSARIAMAQLFFTLADIVFAGGCLYALLNAPDVPFIAFLAVYSIATLAGMVSHVPGGLGVFESILLLSFHGLISTESLAAALLLYRAVYHLVPLSLAAALLAGREALDRVRP